MESTKIKSLQEQLTYLQSLPQCPERDCLIEQKQEEIELFNGNGSSYHFSTSKDRAVAFHQFCEVTEAFQLMHLITEKYEKVKHIINES